MWKVAVLGALWMASVAMAGCDSSEGTDDTSTRTDTTQTSNDSVSDDDAPLDTADAFDSIEASDTSASDDTSSPDTSQVEDVGGTKACHEIATCVSECAADTNPEACGQACIETGTAGAQSAWLALQPCLSTAADGCKEAFIACLEPFGNLSCGAVQNRYLDACGVPTDADPACALSVAHEVAPDEAPYLADMAVCLFPCFTACNGNSSCNTACILQDCRQSVDVCVEPTIRCIPPMVCL